ncbi:fer-1-like protein 6 [Periophthalmus magnuspinnatus]|uniref:fer-1-like protein 6 n=1 Tax=Periophthalmus magnuspinnatus TaxID=409849 RepID=UPI00145AEB24|nr:fer-1-like protein 6 [Periophthalmus magnuspinnatus]
MDPTFKIAKNLFGLKKKKRKLKKKNTSDLVLSNQGALDAEAESQSDEDHEEENPEDQCFVHRRERPHCKRSKLNTHIQDSEGKPQNFRISINVTEARQLLGDNIDPCVVIEIGEEKKQTSVKESTNAPFYNECFVFDIFAHKEVFLDKVIKLSVIHSKMLRNSFIGSFKLDVWTVYKQPGHQFNNKWAQLTDPRDKNTGVKGFLKCDISISEKGDTIEQANKSSSAEEQIDKNLLLPEGFPSERPWAQFSVRIYKAEGLPRNSSTIMANVTKALNRATLIDPYVEVRFFKQTGRTSTQRSSADPVWNEQIIFTEMFPPLCQRIKIQVLDEGSVNDVALGTHYFDLRRISNEQDGDRGFLPTFGPAWINLYGSTRSQTLGDDTVELNEGIGEGVSFRGRIYIELVVEILSGGSDSKQSRIRTIKDIKNEKPGPGKDGPPAAATGGSTEEGKAEVLPVEPLSKIEENENFFLFGTLFEASMIDRKIGDKPISFEFSLGNYGNVFDPALPSPAAVPSPALSHRRKALDIPDGTDLLNVSPSSSQTPLLSTQTPDFSRSSKSSTTPEKPHLVEGTRHYMYLPLEKQKPCINLVSQWEGRTYRLYISNMLENIANHFEESLDTVTEYHRKCDPKVIPQLRVVLLEFCTDAKEFMSTADAMVKAEVKSDYLTLLDKKRLTMCKQELQSMVDEATSLSVRLRKTDSIKDVLREARKLTKKLQFLVEEPQHTVPDLFIWLLSNNKRVAYARVKARDILFSNSAETCGTNCGKIQTLFLKTSSKRGITLSVQAKIDVYLWFGSFSDAWSMLDNLPPGFTAAEAADPNNPPLHLQVTEQHKFQLRCHMYQARGLIAADNSGLSDPFARVTFISHSHNTNIVQQTLSPSWDQCLEMSQILLEGDLQYIENEAPCIIIEVYDEDTVGKAEYLGSTVVVPTVQLASVDYVPPALQYFPLHCGNLDGGDVLAAFELLEIQEARPRNLPQLETNEAGFLTVPQNIRPVLSTYRLEVLFWGLRQLKKVQLLSVDRPQVFIECAGKSLRSSVIPKYKSNPNFPTQLDVIELELPENERIHPNLTITVVDWRAFGRSTLVGNHIISNLKAYTYVPPPVTPATSAPTAPTCSTIVTVLASEDQSTQAEESPSSDAPSPHLEVLVEDSSVHPSSKPAEPQKELDPKASRRFRSTRQRRRTIADESAENVIDWWSKYYASVEKLAKQHDGTTFTPLFTKIGGFDGDKKKNRIKDTPVPSPINCKLATLTLYTKELEAEFAQFNDWVDTFELYRGKANTEEDEERFVGKFKGRFCLYKVPDDDDVQDNTDFFRVSRGIPQNHSVQVLIRVYIVSATNLQPADPDGGADPYIVVRIGKNEIKDRDNYIPKQLNPIFGRSFEIQAKFPQESLLSVLIYDFDLVGGDDLMGETLIDLENRFYSRHRATCGLPTEYSEQGYNAWRDCLKPSEILSKLCRENGLSGPSFAPGRITIGEKVFTGATVFMHDEEPKESYEDLSLKVLHQWSDIMGYSLVPEHIESRTLYNKSRPGMDQGQLKMWVDMFPMDMPRPGPSVDISPRKPKPYELRVIVWNTEDVVLEDTNIITGQSSSDIYIKSWLKGLENDRQETDVHYNSLTGEGNFNWRFVFPFNYLPAEKMMVVQQKEHIFSLDKAEKKFPTVLVLQVWDFDTLSSDDFIGTVELDLHSFSPGAKSSKTCKGDMLTAAMENISIFQQKRARGWWPFSKCGELTGKVEAEFHLLTAEEASKNPAGKARNEPDPLPKPNRPDTSFSWFVNPFKCFFYLVWNRFKKYIILGLLILITALFLALLFYTLPGAISARIVGH